MPPAPRTLVSLLALAVAGCGTFSNEDDGPPEFVRYEISEGSCHGCPLPEPFVVPGTDGAVTLRLNTRYTMRTYIRTAGRSDRCIYNMVAVSWLNSNHDFNCTPETGAAMQMDYPVTTDDFVVRSFSEHFLVLSLREYEIETREGLSGGELARIPVRFDR